MNTIADLFMKNIIYILCLVISLGAMAQPKQAAKSKISKPVAKKAKSNPAVTFEKKELTADQKVTLTKMAYDIYRTQFDAKPSLLDNTMSMLDVVMPNSINPTTAEIHAAIDQLKKGFSAKLHKATSFVTVAGVPQRNAYWVTVNADCKMLPYSRYVDFDSKWTAVKNKKGVNMMLMNENDQKKENNLAFYSNQNLFSYNLIVDYNPGDSLPKHVTGDIKISVPKKFEVLELKKADLDKDYTIGKSKVKLVKLLPRTYAIQIEGDEPSLKMFVVSDGNKQFTSHTTSYVSFQQYEAFRQPKVLQDSTLATLGAKVNDISDVNRVKVGKVKGTGNILKIVLFRATEFEKVDIKLDLNHIEVQE